MIDINKLTPKDIEEKLPQIDGITKTIAQKVAAYAAKKRASGKIAFESKEELNKVLKSAKLNSRYMPGVMDTIAIVGAGIEPIGIHAIERLLPNFSYDKLVLEMQIELPASLRKFKKPEEVEIIKPDSETQQIKPNKDLALNTRLCEISNLPEKREEPIKTYNLLLSNIDLDDFNGGAPLDSYQRASLNGVDFSDAIGDYIQSYGENRYQYLRPFLSNSLQGDIGDSYTYETYYNYIVEKGKNVFLYEGASGVLRDFRNQYFGWGTANNLSLYTIDEIHIAIRNIPDVFSQIKERLRVEIFSNLRILEQELVSIIEPAIGERLAIVDYILDKTSGFASQDEKSHFSWYKVRYQNQGARERLFTENLYIDDTFNDTFLSKKMDEGFEIDELNGIDSSKIFRKLYFIKNSYVRYEQEFGTKWNSRGVLSNYNNRSFIVESFKVREKFLPFLFKLRAELINSNDLSGEYAHYLDRRNQLSKKIEELTRIHNLLTDGSDLINENIISKILNELSASMSLKLYVPDFLSHAVMLKDANKNIVLVTPPDNRLHNLLDYAPNMGIVTEFSLEILHQKFGFGKHLYSESLFPGEEVTLEVSSKSKKEVEVTTTSSEKIFEEANEKTSSDFQEEVNKELNDSYNKNLTSSESVNLSASGGVFGISLSAGYNNQSSSSESINNAAKKVNNVTNKLAKELSDQRQVTFEKSTTEKSIYSSEEENKSTRKFVNINKERTLTFNFFQITREYQSTLYLEDIELLYSTGKFNFATIFINVEDIYDLTNQEYVASISGLKQFLNEVSANTVQTVRHLIDSKTIRKLPSEFSDNFEKGAVMIVYSPPYSQTIPLSQANYFLANTFKPGSKTQKELNNLIWKFIGNGSVSPDGIGVGAFPFSWDDYESDESIEWPVTQRNASPFAKIATHKVVADKIKVVIDKKESEFELPNLDLCFNKVRHFRTRYVSTAENRNSLPLAVMQKNYVINTNGVYCENMLGKCGALEEFATTHRKLDVEAKQLEVKKTELMLPPSIENYTKDGEIDFDTYSKAVEQYEKIVKAWNVQKPIENTES